MNAKLHLTLSAALAAAVAAGMPVNDNIAFAAAVSGSLLLIALHPAMLRRPRRAAYFTLLALVTAVCFLPFASIIEGPRFAVTIPMTVLTAAAYAITAHTLHANAAAETKAEPTTPA